MVLLTSVLALLVGFGVYHVIKQEAKVTNRKQVDFTKNLHDYPGINYIGGLSPGFQINALPINGKDVTRSKVSLGIQNFFHKMSKNHGGKLSLCVALSVIVFFHRWRKNYRLDH